ncbi:hypothetical protein L1987_52470 [Smallanthus sonchifolius]|uniref:Uncharacterized protein n=1 Tax=Smallanthus sonchifolius TaxID=185202 RepID=A0ACB9ET84_9ASTR|nr:hypothetical protein L1987_52470 [Smallanthus sonchifolius]
MFVKVDWDKWVDEDEKDEKGGADMDFGDVDFSVNTASTRLARGGGDFDTDDLDDGNDEDSDTEEEAKEGESIGKNEVVALTGNQVEAGA